MRPRHKAAENQRHQEDDEPVLDGFNEAAA